MRLGIRKKAETESGPQQREKWDPDPHRSAKPDPGIHIELKSRIYMSKSLAKF